MKDLLFQNVVCQGYLKKINDGRYIESYENENGTFECTYSDSNNADLNIECEYCGELDFLKTYFEYKERIFTGIVVGFKKIVATGYLTVDTCYGYYGTEYTKFGKHPKDMYQCAIVYFSNNKKRYVPLDKISLKGEHIET